MSTIPVTLLSILAFSLGSFVSAEPAYARRLQREELGSFLSSAPKSTLLPVVDLRRRQITSYQSTCGFETGDPDKPRTAQPGFDCRTDTLNGLWGFCPTTVISATDCGLVGNCVDSFACTSGCGIFGNSEITTFTCSASGGNHCSSALLTDTSDATYTYITCGASPITDHLLAVFTTAAAAITTISLSPSAAPTTLLGPIPISSSSSSLSATSNSLSPSLSSTSSLSSSLSSSSCSSSYLAPSSSVFSTAPFASGTSFPMISSTSSISNNAGAIVGGVIGGLALVSLVTLAILFLRIHQAGVVRMQPGPTVSAQIYDRYGDIYNRSRKSTVAKNPWNDPRGPIELSSYPTGNFRN